MSFLTHVWPPSPAIKTEGQDRWFPWRFIYFSWLHHALFCIILISSGRTWQERCHPDNEHLFNPSHYMHVKSSSLSQFRSRVTWLVPFGYLFASNRSIASCPFLVRYICLVLDICVHLNLLIWEKIICNDEYAKTICYTYTTIP